MGLSPKAYEPPSPSPVGTHTYTTAGNFVVKVRASSGNQTATSQKTVSIGSGGPPPPLNTFDVVGGTFNSLNNTWNVSAGNVLTFTAGEPDAAATFAWDFGDGDTAAGKTVTHVYRLAGRETVTLSVTGGGTDTSGLSVSNATFIVAPPSFQAIMVPGAGSICELDSELISARRTERPGPRTSRSRTREAVRRARPRSRSTSRRSALPEIPVVAIPSDLSTLPFDSLKSVPLGPGESWSAVDVVGTTLERPGAGKGILLVKFEGGNQLPIVTARVYFTAQGASFGTALPSFLVGPFGPLTAQAAQVATGQYLIGLREDSLYRFNISLFNASSEGGLFHIDAVSEDGVAAGSKDFAVPAYSQAGVNPADVIPNIDSTKRYVLKATSTAGSLQAYSSQLDRRNNDPVQVSDDTPRVNAAPDTTVTYYVAGVGRIEENGAHWRTDLRFYNSSAFQRNVALEYHYVPAGSTTEQVLFNGGLMGAGQGVSVDDVIAQLFAPGHPERPELMSGTVIGLLKVTYSAPSGHRDGAAGHRRPHLPGFPAGHRGHAALGLHLGQERVGHQRAALHGGRADEPALPHQRRHLRDGRPSHDRPDHGRQAGWHSGRAVRLPPQRPGQVRRVRADPGHEDTFPDIDGDPMAMKVETLDGSPVGSYIVTLDNISSDTVFVQGTPVR